MISRAVSGPSCVDLGTVDLLARLRLHAGLRVRRPTPELHELVDLCGLVEVLFEPEEREQLLGVEEERELGDPPA
jgi:hypothetical protein